MFLISTLKKLIVHTIRPKIEIFNKKKISKLRVWSFNLLFNSASLFWRMITYIDTDSQLPTLYHFSTVKASQFFLNICRKNTFIILSSDVHVY